MKKLLFLSLILSISFSSQAQNTSEADMIFAIFKSEKKELVRDYLDLPKENDAAFWKLYESYELKRTKLAERRVNILNQYVDKYKNLSKAEAKAISREFFAIRKSYLKLSRKYFKKMSKVIGSKKATGFVQLEEYIEMMVRFEILNVIPFVDED